MNYFDTTEAMPAQYSLRSGLWHLMYEAGKLRYFSLGNIEVLRMIYPAVRDRHWRTASAQILNEKIMTESDSFRIEYQALYQLEDVAYQARYLLQGDARGQISMEMWGEAQSDFWRNRIGWCVLHPIDSCAGKPVTLLHPDGKQTESQFPDLISPHQPLVGVQGMTWQPTEDLRIQLQFEGEVFETEDQRNWSDASYKTYGTPLALPFPVKVQRGEPLYQKITLDYQTLASLVEQGAVPTTVKILTSSYPFPRLGSDWTTHMQANAIPLPLNFLNVLLNPERSDWAETLKAVSKTAAQLGLKMGVNVSLPDSSWLAPLIDALAEEEHRLHHLCIISNPVPSSALMEEVYPRLKARFPQCPIGYGTDGFFAELNRNRPQTDAFDFVQFSLNPQVHAEDTLTLIENLSAQRDIIRTAQHFAPGKAIQVAPITLRWRYNPDPKAAIDPRQHSAFAAAWTLLSLKYLAPAAALSYFEWMGEKGILTAEGNSILAGYLNQIAQFQPVKIVDTFSSNPLKKDLLLLENARGERLGFEVDFEKGKILVSN